MIDLRNLRPSPLLNGNNLFASWLYAGFLAMWADTFIRFPASFYYKCRRKLPAAISADENEFSFLFAPPVRQMHTRRLHCRQPNILHYCINAIPAFKISSLDCDSAL